MATGHRSISYDFEYPPSNNHGDVRRLHFVEEEIIKGSLEEILPSYEKLRSAYAHVRDAKRSRLTVGRVETLGAAHVRRMCGAVSAAAPVEIEA